MMPDDQPIDYELTDDGASFDDDQHPVDSTYYACCDAVGGHSQYCYNTIACEAIDIAERIRHVDPYQLHCELVELHPAKAAQLLMAFAAWFDLDITCAELQLRAEQVATEQASV